MKKYLTLKNLGWLLTAIVAIMLGMAGTSKIMGTQEMIGNFTYFHLESLRISCLPNLLRLYQNLLPRQ
jgi:hypothetical protein